MKLSLCTCILYLYCISLNNSPTRIVVTFSQCAYATNLFLAATTFTYNIMSFDAMFKLRICTLELSICSLILVNVGAYCVCLRAHPAGHLTQRNSSCSRKYSVGGNSVWHLSGCHTLFYSPHDHSFTTCIIHVCDHQK